MDDAMQTLINAQADEERMRAGARHFLQSEFGQHLMQYMLFYKRACEAELIESDDSARRTELKNQRVAINHLLSWIQIKAADPVENEEVNE